MEAYKKEVMSRIKSPVMEKMEAAAPYNFFLTTVEDSPKTHEELLSISFPELLDPYFGELECSLQMNCLVDLEFLMAQYQITGNESKPLTLLYNNCDISDKFSHVLTHANVKPPSDFGSHHTKMMIFRYTNKSVRVVISTANLIESDWGNRTQGLWISPECPALPLDHCDNTGAGESATFFKRDLLEYLWIYRLPILQPWIEAIKEVDMSHVSDWHCQKRHRTQASPHIKSYCRISENHEQMYYFVLTSANMSKAAWGRKNKSGRLNISSYEAGILFAPQMMVNKDTFPLSADEDGIKAFPLPYDLPLVPYTHADVPWFIDNLTDE